GPWSASAAISRPSPSPSSEPRRPRGSADREAASTAGQGRQRDGADRRVGLTRAPRRRASAALAAAALVALGGVGGGGGVLDRGRVEGGPLGGLPRAGTGGDPAVRSAPGPLPRPGPRPRL